MVMTMPKGMLRWHLRNRIAMVREARGLTQQTLAEMLHVSRPQVARWETDVNLPPPRVVGRIAQALRCRPRDLFPKDYI
jgi:transcriptional regulator with XRE-family HTH domain